MNLRSYLDEKKMTPAQFAAAISVSGAAVHRYLVGDRKPKTEVMERIIEVTDGVVQPNDFFNMSRSPIVEAP